MATTTSNPETFVGPGETLRAGEIHRPAKTPHTYREAEVFLAMLCGAVMTLCGASLYWGAPPTPDTGKETLALLQAEAAAAHAAREEATARWRTTATKLHRIHHQVVAARQETARAHATKEEAQSRATAREAKRAAVLRDLATMGGAPEWRELCTAVCDLHFDGKADVAMLQAAKPATLRTAAIAVGARVGTNLIDTVAAAAGKPIK